MSSCFGGRVISRKLVSLCTAVFVVFFVAIAHAQLPQVTSGLTYLSSSQSADGTWSNGSSSVDTTAATVTALDSLKLLNQSSTLSYAAGISWLQGQSPQSVAYIAERVRTLNPGDGSIDTLIAALDTLKGAWGGGEGYETDILDTAVVLQALKAANYADVSVTNKALAYLTTNQNGDGGWGFYQGGASSVHITAVVSATLQQFPQVSTIASAVGKASAYLLAHQNADGGFGSSESTVYESALAYSALVAVSSNATALANAVNYLSSSQSANGSWNDDPYSTALAVRALYLSENKPSPPPAPPAGGTITGTVIDAVTKARVSGVAVVLESDALANTITDASGNFTLKDVAAGTQSINLSASGYAPKSASTTVAVDSVANLGNVALVSSYSTGTVGGTITDAAGKPLADVAVTVGGSWSGSAVTLADGSYSFSYVTPGEVTLTAEKTGYTPVAVPGTVFARTKLTFSPRLSTTTSTDSTGTLVGRVVDSLWGLPIGHLPEETGVTVTVSGGISVAVEPDTRGYFTISGLAPNTYQVTVGMNGFSAKTFRVVISAGVTTDLGTVTLDWSLSEMTLIGKVTDAHTGAPIENARVDVSDTMLSGITDFAGSYAIAGIPYPSEFTLKIHADKYLGTSYVVTSSPSTQTIDVALEPEVTTGTLTGTVVDASSGQPLAGVTLTMAGTPAASTSTGADGTFIITDAPKGVRQIDIVLDGYPSRTLTTAVSAGTNNNVGKIPLGLLPLPASVRGTVRDAAANTPFAAVQIDVTGTGTLQATTGDDGNYQFPEVVPGTITVAATPAKPGYFAAHFTGELAPGGLMVFSPFLSTATPAGASLTVTTDRAVYQANETVDISVSVLNRVSAAATASLALRIEAPSGATVYNSGAPLSLPADGTAAQYFSFVLPATSQGGNYTIRAELFGENGAILGTGSGSFGISVSRIAVTPVLPAAFSAGENAVSFNLANSGDIAVASGVLEVRLKDPEGATVFSASQDFTLDRAQSRTLSYSVVVPPLKFGTYTLSYTQKDETVAGRAADLALPNSVGIAARYDDGSHRVRETANLTVTVENTGKFKIDSTGSGVLVTADVPDATYTETKAVSPVPTVGNATGSTLLYRFVIPETMTAGQHATKITVALPSGATVAQTTQLAIPESSIAVSLEQSAYRAGETISLVLANSGGVDAQILYRLSLYDVKSTLVAEKAGTGSAMAGGALHLALVVRNGSLDGTYNLVVNYKDVKTGADLTSPQPVTITGVQGSLQVRTEKESYLSTENVTGLNSIVNGGSDLQGGNLHLQVTTAGGSLQKKTWTSQYDFQQGVRKGVDTFEMPDNVTLAVASDNFDDGLFNADRWGYGAWGDCLTAPPTERGGALQMVVPQCLTVGKYGETDIGITNKVKLSGDFDVSIDYNVTSTWQSPDNQIVSFAVRTPYNNLDISQWRSASYGAIYGSRWILNGTHTWTLGGNGAAQGKLRITRIGSTFSSYYWNGNGWTMLMTQAGRSDGDATVEVGARTATPSRPLEITYDNFTVKPHIYPASGTLNLKYDSGRSDVWGKLDYTADLPGGTSIKFRTRTAETESGLTAAAWSQYFTANGSAITSPQGRWIEVESTLETTNTKITPVLHDLTVTQGRDPGFVLWQADVPVNLTEGQLSDLSHSIGRLNASGRLYLQGALTSGTGQMIATSEYPFYVGQGSTGLTISTDKSIYKPGEAVAITGEVKNNATAAATGLTLTVKGKPVGGTEQTIGTSSFDVPAGGSRTFTYAATAGSDGAIDLSATVSQSSATLAQVSTRYEVALPNATATLTAPDSAGTEPFAVSLTLVNTGKTDAVITIGKSFAPQPETITVPAGQTKLLQYTQQISSNTTYTFTLGGDLQQTLSKTVAYAVNPLQSGVSGKIVTDKISYLANQQVTLTATVTTTDAMENLSANITVTNSLGQGVFSSQSVMAALVPGQSIGINKYWNTGTNPVGTYLVSLQLVNAAGVAISGATCDLTIGSTTRPTALLKGQLTLDKQIILAGEPVNVSYGVTNTGNLDLSGVEVSLLTVAVDEETVYDSSANQTNLPMGGNYADSRRIDTTSYRAKDYLVLLRASVAGGETETLAGAYFRVEGAPTAPALSSPAQGADVETFTPVLSVGNAADPNDDRLTYQFEIYSDSGLMAQVHSTVVPETAANTTWTIPAPLAENHTYFWRTRAYDGRLYGPWMEVSSFRVNTVDDAPSAPTISSPVDGTDVAVLNPVLSINNATDHDSTDLTYNFEIALDSGFTQMVASVQGIAAGDGTTSWTVPVALQENTSYYWRAQADDWLVEGPWSGTARLFVNTANDAPTAPVVVSPAYNATVTSLTADVVVTNGTDPDSPSISYLFEADTAPIFDTTDLIRSGGIAAGEGGASWSVTGLKDNTRYYVRAKASDGIAESPWSAVTGFFVNTVNDAPTTPTLANPSDKSGVKVSAPTLSIHNSSDLDGDVISYRFEVYADAAMTTLVVGSDAVTEMAGVTSWQVPQSLTENQTYYWRARAFDGVTFSEWMPSASFTVNTANDAPGAPKALLPAEGSSVTTTTPLFAVANAFDPDSDSLTYQFEVYSDGLLVGSGNGIAGDSSGTTNWTPGTSLADNTVYHWRARAWDGESYGPWTPLSSFTVHIPRTSISATVDFDPDTLNRGSNGTWVVVYIELPAGNKVSDIDISTIRLEGTVPAQVRPFGLGDHDKDGIPDLMVKFKRSEVINLLGAGDKVTVEVTGKVGDITFEGVDVIRVIK